MKIHMRYLWKILFTKRISTTLSTNAYSRQINNTNVELCDEKLFANSICLKYHIRIIHNRKYFYKCDECEKTTKTANELFGHISYRHRQSSIRLFDCEKCGKSFKSMSNMKRHISSFHSNNPNKCQCNKCGKYFKSIYWFEKASTISSFDTAISMRSMRENQQTTIESDETHSIDS